MIEGKGNKKSLGSAGEDFAAAVLAASGYEIIERNYRCRLGEIDIITAKDGILYFTEIKTRRNLSMGLPRESVSRHKQQKIRAVAAYYIQNCRSYASEYRFKVIEILYSDINDTF